MRDNDSQVTTVYEFFLDEGAPKLFARLDYELRKGKHIQLQYPGQELLFRFINKHIDSLQKYYRDFFGVSLEEGGERTQKYYFLDSASEVNSKIPSPYRQTLKGEFVIIGIFLCKMYYVDFSEINTLTSFKVALREEYESYRESFYRVFAYAKGDKYTEGDDENVSTQIEKAFKEFDRLGWVELKGDDFEVMPSLERLRKLYVSEIQNIDELFKTESE